MNKILLITTKGCDACDIMRNAVHQAVGATKKDVECEDKDFSEVDKDFIKKYGIKDFPTTLFFKNNRLVRKEVATRPYIVVLRWIDIDFK